MLTWRSKALALTSNFGIGFIPPAVEPGGDLCDFVETGIWRGGARIVLAGARHVPKFLIPYRPSSANSNGCFAAARMAASGRKQSLEAAYDVLWKSSAAAFIFVASPHSRCTDALKPQ